MIKKIEDLNINIHEQRLLVFIETDSQSGKFNQVMLDKKQFKRVSDAIFTKSENQDGVKKGYEIGEIRYSEENYILPDLISIY